MYLENAQPVYNYVRYLDIAKLIKQAGKCSDRELKLYYKSRYVLENTKGCVNENAASVQNSNVLVEKCYIFVDIPCTYKVDSAQCLSKAAYCLLEINPSAL